jgi:adenine-specific DNA methylase
LQEVSLASLREKQIRRGHIGTLHLWWARRPLAASRATALAALLPDDPACRAERTALLAQLAAWENLDDGALWPQARDLVRRVYPEHPPRVLDPFAGGGSIPLEAARLGCETHAVDYNPVAVLLLKAVLEFPYGAEGLEAAVRTWTERVHRGVRAELAPFYPPETAGCLWARTITCQNPSCAVAIPLMRQTWLARKPRKRIALLLQPEAERITARIVTGDAITFDPSQGTVSRATVRCPRCGATVDAATTRRLFREGRTGLRLMAVACAGGRSGTSYRVPEDRDREAYRQAEARLADKREALRRAWGIDPVPDEPLPPQETLGFRVQRYGLERWCDLFNARQALALVTVSEKVRAAYEGLAREDGAAFARSVTVYLSFLVSKLADWNSVLSVWRPDQERNEHVFNRQALPMVWDYAERNPCRGALLAGRSIAAALAHVRAALDGAPSRPQVRHASAVALPFPDNHFDGVFTDPPYYDNVPYSDLSDFFYVHLRRAAGDLFPDLFATPLAPKTEEIVQDPARRGGARASKAYFQAMLARALGEIHRVLKPDGIVVLVFAHKTTQAWETVVTALLDAGLYPTASWPIHTEMRTRLRAQRAAALASSVYLVCRKRTEEATGEYPQVKREIESAVRDRLRGFWTAGIGGADLFMSAVGPALHAFGRYRRVEKLSGEPVGAAELLDYVRQVVADFTLGRILGTAPAGGVDAETRFYLLWRWVYGNGRTTFDEARKLAHCVGVELSELWARPGGFVQRAGEHVHVLGPRDRAHDAGSGPRSRPPSLIDTIHRAALTWERNEHEAARETEGATETFWQVAQAISEVLPAGAGEKQLLQGLLYSRRL